MPAWVSSANRLIIAHSGRQFAIIQVYASTESLLDDEVENMYEDISRAIHSSETHFLVVMGYFNAIVKRSGDEWAIWLWATEPGQRLANLPGERGTLYGELYLSEATAKEMDVVESRWFHEK